MLCAAGAGGVLKKEETAPPGDGPAARQRGCPRGQHPTNRKNEKRQKDAAIPHKKKKKKKKDKKKKRGSEAPPPPNHIFVGSGPAGISAALYAVRAGVDTTVLTKGPGALDRAEKIENYYGFAEPVSGAELERRSIENAKRLGVSSSQPKPWA